MQALVLLVFVGIVVIGASLIVDGTGGTVVCLVGAGLFVGGVVALRLLPGDNEREGSS